MQSSFFKPPFVNGEIYPCVSKEVFDMLPELGEEALEEYYATAGDGWMMACPEECVGQVSISNILNNYATLTEDGETSYVFYIPECDEGFLAFFADYVGDWADACVWITSTQATGGI